MEPFALAREQSKRTPGRYVGLAIAVGGSTRAACFVDGTELDDHPRSSIASITKPITATAVMQLVEAGEVDLHAPIQTYIPEFRARLRTGAEPSSAVTIARILSHTSGLTDLPDDELFQLPPTPNAMLAAVCATRLAYEPGTEFRYASEPWYLLSATVERVSGMPFADFVRDRILRPLGMSSTGFDPTSPGPPPLPPLGVFGGPDTSPDTRIGLFASLVMPGGGLWSTPHDVLRFGRAMLGRGQLEGARIMGPDSFAGMTTLQTDASRSVAPVPQCSTGSAGAFSSARGAATGHLAIPARPGACSSSTRNMTSSRCTCGTGGASATTTPTRCSKRSTPTSRSDPHDEPAASSDASSIVRSGSTSVIPSATRRA